MIKPLKLYHPDEETWFVSDLHFHHDREFLWKKRNYNSILDHDKELINQWNDVCTENAIVFSLGDFVFSDPDGKKFSNIIRRLNFKTLYLLLGNHNSGQQTIYKNAVSKIFPSALRDNKLTFEIYPFKYNMEHDQRDIIFLPQYAEIILNGQVFILCHYPIISHNQQANGAIHLCGHSHQSCELTNKNTGQGKRLDVGIEGFGRPINAKEIKTFLKNRALDTRDHHD